MARCPVMDLKRPLYAFANVYYKLDRPETSYRKQRVEALCLSSNLETATPQMLRAAGVKATDRPELLIDDFARRTHDWYVLRPDQFLEEQTSTSLRGWDQIDQLGIRAYVEAVRGGRSVLPGSKAWSGPRLEFRVLKWMVREAESRQPARPGARPGGS